MSDTIRNIAADVRHVAGRSSESPDPRPHHDQAPPKEDVVRSILQGRKHIVSYPGTSQYSQAATGFSACGLAALNCLSTLLANVSEATQPDVFIKRLTTREALEDISAICSLWSSNLHLEVEDLYKLPPFSEDLELIYTHYGKPSSADFQSILHRLMTTGTSAGVIITRPPEIVTVIKFLVSGITIFLTFDSHPRPSHPDGAAFIFNGSLSATVSHLDNLFRVDARLIADRHMQWQAQLLSQYSGHVFVQRRQGIKARTPSTHDALMASLATLQTRLQISDLQNQNAQLQAELNRLNQERAIAQMLRRENAELKAQNSQLLSQNRALSSKAAGMDELKEEVRYLRQQKGAPDTPSAAIALGEVPNEKGVGFIGSGSDGRSSTAQSLVTVSSPSHAPSISPETNVNHVAPLKSMQRSTGSTSQGAKHVSSPEDSPYPGQSDPDVTQEECSHNDGILGVPLAQRTTGDPRHVNSQTSPSTSMGHSHIDTGDVRYVEKGARMPNLQRQGDERDQSSPAERQRLSNTPRRRSTIRRFMDSILPGKHDPHDSQPLDSRRVSRVRLELGQSSRGMEQDQRTAILNMRQDEQGSSSLFRSPQKLDGPQSPLTEDLALVGLQREDSILLTEQEIIDTILSLSLSEEHDRSPHPTSRNEAAPSGPDIQPSPSDASESVLSVQAEARRENLALRQQHLLSSTTHSPPVRRRERPYEQSRAEPSVKQNGTAHPWDYDHRHAIQLQTKFNREHERIVQERQELSGSLQVKFDCPLCLETHPEDNVAFVESCGHKYCRTCLRRYVRHKLIEQRFPIFCPTCIAEDKGNPASIPNRLAQQVGMSEKENARWVEMELAEFSILLHCRRCRRSAFVDRREHDKEKIIICPFYRCGYTWCKSCQKAVSPSGRNHSCDGSLELKRLMEAQGWKYCPGCNTPIQRSTGCAHMTCISPGCNTHFCYLCGQSIIRSALRSEIESAISSHYSRNCTLFEEVAR